MSDQESQPAPIPAPETPKAPEAQIDRAVAAGYPPDSGPEQDVLYLHPSMFRAKPLMFLGLAVLALAGITCSLMYGVFGMTPKWIVWPSLLAMIAGLVTLGIWWLQTRGESLKITNKRCVQRQGLFSKRTSEVLHDNIRSIEIYQSFWQRIWRVGRLAVSSAGHDGFELDISDISKPDEVRKIMDLYRTLD